jgi:phosphopantothenoylcysteine decarboxylase/phosphopantothenate--cysteine ligase
VGFAAEHGSQGIERARGKLERKRIDTIVVNDVSREDIGFDAEQNEVTIITASGEHHVSRRSKDEVAGLILDQVQEARDKSELSSDRSTPGKR